MTENFTELFPMAANEKNTNKIEKVTTKTMSQDKKAAEGGAAEDGDFVALRAKRQARLKRQYRKASKKTKQTEALELVLTSMTKEEEDVDPIGELTPLVTARPSSQDSNRVASPDSQQKPGKSRSAIFAQAPSATQEQFLALMNETRRLDAVDPDTNLTILLHVLHEGRQDLARLVVVLAEPGLLCKDCEVTVASLKGKKNALHYATELHDLQLAMDILNKISDRALKMKLLTQETPVQIEGQRPRTLPCCHLASFLGDKELVVLYLSQGVQVDAVNSKKDTALLWAARWNYVEVVQELLDRRANANIANDKGSTALYWAVRYGHTETVRLLITKGGANVNATRKLGLVSPVIVACALGYLPIVKILIEGGADPNQTIRGKERPIHHAAREGYSKIIEYLLDNGARINEKDEGGDNALLLAASHGHARCLQLLLARGAKTTVKNHMGEDLMSLAVASDNEKIMKIVLHSLQTEPDGNAGKKPRSPLLLAAAGGLADKVTSLLSLGLDPGDTDEEGNTMMHHAAMANHSHLIMAFHSKVKVDAQNKHGNTALHLACVRGHAESIAALISSKATASIRNAQGETALHLAASCRAIQPDTVKKLMDYVIKSHAWGSLSIKDNDGNNALHVAAKVARAEVMWEFRHVPLKVKDADGNTALHAAVRPNEPEVLDKMLDMYESMKRDADINDKNGCQETVLHLAAKEGFHEHISRLVLFGADLSAQDKEGNTVFHQLTQLSAAYPQRAKTYLAVFQVVLDQATMWWCMKQQRQYPHGDSGALEAYSRQASLQLLTDTFNKGDLNVIALACQVGASDIVGFILSKKGIMCHEEDKYVIYDVTNMTPLTNNSVTGCCGGGRGTVVPRPSYIEFLLSLDHPEAACKVLDVQPFRTIERVYSSVAAWTYILIMIVHIIYMSLLSYSGIVLLERRRTDPDSSKVDAALVFLYAVAPIEPAIILLYDVYKLFKAIYHGELSAGVRLKRVLKDKVFQKFLYEALPILLGIAYSCLVISWIILYKVNYNKMEYVFSVTVCIGWLYTISFTRGVRIIHYFWRMIQNMIVKDIFKFLFIYLFVLLAFSFAFHSVFQVSASVAEIYPSPFDSAFLVFNLMIGMDELFTDDFQTFMNNAGRTTVYPKVMYLIYIILGTILLLNLLIAMMNDSYSSILTQHSVYWRIESVQLGVDIEKSFPITTSLFSRTKFTRTKSPHGFASSSFRTSKRASLHPAALARIGDDDAPSPTVIATRSAASNASSVSSSWYHDVWSIAVPTKNARDTGADHDETDREALRELRGRLASVEQRVTSDLQQVKHDLDDIRCMLQGLAEAGGTRKRESVRQQ